MSDSQFPRAAFDNVVIRDHLSCQGTAEFKKSMVINGPLVLRGGLFTSGVNIEDAKFSSGISTDTIVENTPGNGVTVEGVKMKDGAIFSSLNEFTTSYTAFRNTPSGLVNEIELVNGADGPGEVIAFNPDDGLLYHFSGESAGDIVMETIDPLTLATTPIIGPLGNYPGALGNNNVTAAVWYPPANAFLIAVFGNDLFTLTADGTTATLIGNISGVSDTLRGFALVGTIIYGGDVDGTFYRLDPATPSVTTLSIPTGEFGLQINKLLSVTACGERLYVVFGDQSYVGGVSRHDIGELNPVTGIINLVVPANFNGSDLRFSSIVFDETGKLWAITGDGSNTPNTLFSVNGLCATDFVVPPLTGFDPLTVSVVTCPCKGSITNINSLTGEITYSGQNVRELGIDYYQYTINDSCGISHKVTQLICHQFAIVPPMLNNTCDSNFIFSSPPAGTYVFGPRDITPSITEGSNPIDLTTLTLLSFDVFTGTSIDYQGCPGIATQPFGTNTSPLIDSFVVTQPDTITFTGAGIYAGSTWTAVASHDSAGMVSITLSDSSFIDLINGNSAYSFKLTYEISDTAGNKSNIASYFDGVAAIL